MAGASHRSGGNCTAFFFVLTIKIMITRLELVGLKLINSIGWRIRMEISPPEFNGVQFHFY